MTPMRVLIADDHLFYRQRLRVMLGAVPEIQLVGEATSGDEATERALALQPDVVLMDLKMPGASGIEATRRIVGENFLSRELGGAEGQCCRRDRRQRLRYCSECDRYRQRKRLHQSASEHEICSEHHHCQ